MKARSLLPLLLIFILGACVASGTGTNPWASQTSQPEIAEQPPHQLGPIPARAFGTQYPHRPLSVPAETEEKADSEGLQPEYGSRDYDIDSTHLTDIERQRLPATHGLAAAASAPPPVSVALLLPLSGPHADLGQAMLQSAQMALFDMKYQSFELVPRDTKGTPDGARQAAQSALDNGAQLILGPLLGDEVQAVKPLVRRHDALMIAFSTNWTLADRNTFIMGFLPFAQVQRIAGYAASNNLHNVGIFAPNNQYGNAVISSYGTYSRQIGLPPAQIHRFEPGRADLTVEIDRFAENITRSRLRSGPLQALLLPVGGDQARSIVNLAAYKDFNGTETSEENPEEPNPQNDIQYLGTGLWDDHALASEKLLNGAWFAAPSPDLRRDFEQRYRMLYGNAPPRLATLTYDATALATVLARNGFQRGAHPDFTRSALTNPNGFAGIDGIFRFRNDGLVERGLAVLEIRHGDLKVIDPAPRTFQHYGQ